MTGHLPEPAVSCHVENPGQTMTTITYLEMFHRPPEVRQLPEDARVQRLENLTGEQYLELYNGVGRAYGWHERNAMPRESLEAIVGDAAVQVHLLLVGDTPAGYGELDLRQPSQVQLAYFGLFPPFIGRGYGGPFLDHCVQLAWDSLPRRVWVHTCDLDHPNALPNYQRAGFRIYNSERVEDAES